MRVNRAFLYAGVFLVAIGAIAVVADQGAFDAASLADVLRLWPIIPIALGVALVARRSPVSLVAGILAAAIPGVVLGSAIAVLPRYPGSCGERTDPSLTSTLDGVLSIERSAFITTSCGTFNLSTTEGDGWHLAAGNSRGRQPAVFDDYPDPDADGPLTISSNEAYGWNPWQDGRDRWELTLPRSMGSLDLHLNASRSYLDLKGAQIEALSVSGNASDAVLDLTDASVGDFDAFVNTGALSIHLGSVTDFSGYIRVGGGDLQVCTPPDLGLQFMTRGSFRKVSVGGVPIDGISWESPNYASAAHRADLEFRINLGSVSINPIGGCR
jgi:hypothetical protein